MSHNSNTNVTDVVPPYGKKYFFLVSRHANQCSMAGGYTKFIQQKLNQNYLPVWLQDAGYNTYYVGKLMNDHSILNYAFPFAAGYTSNE